MTILALALLLAGQVARATVKTVTYTITDWEITNNTVYVTFTRSGDSPFDTQAKQTFTASFNKSSLSEYGNTAGGFSVELADGFNLQAYWSTNSDVHITNNSFYSIASGISYSVSCDQAYYVTHVTMKSADGQPLYTTSPSKEVNFDYENVIGFNQMYKSTGSFGMLIVTYSDVPTVLNLSLNEAEGRYWGSYFGSANYRLPEGAAAYTMNEYNNLYRVGTDGRIIPANTAVVILSDKKDITLNYTTESASLHNNNILKGSVNPVTLNDGKVGDAVPFVLGMVNSTLGLYQYEGDKIPAGKAYYANGDEVYLNTLTSDFTAKDGQTLIGTLTGGWRITIAAGATVTLQDVNINGTVSSPGITCAGNATLILRGPNRVKAIRENYSGLQPGPAGTTLTIRGTGSLTATGMACGAGIGSSKDTKCGNIRIEGGTISASGGIGAAGIGSGSSTIPNNSNAHENTTCGNIILVGGDVTASGGSATPSTPLPSMVGGGGNHTEVTIAYYGGAGIGSGAVGTCGDITICGCTVSASGWAAAGIGCGAGGLLNDHLLSGNVFKKSVCGSISIYGSTTQVRAEKKNEKTVDTIGRSTSDLSTCGTVKLDGITYWDGEAKNYKNNGASILTQSPLIYPLTH